MVNVLQAIKKYWKVGAVAAAVAFLGLRVVSASKTIDKLSFSLGEAKRANEELIDKVKAGEQRYGELQKQIDAIKEENERLNKEVDSHEVEMNERERLISENDTLEQEAADYKDKYDIAQKTRALLESNITLLKQDVATLKTANASLLAALNRSDEQKEIMRGALANALDVLAMEKENSALLQSALRRERLYSNLSKATNVVLVAVAVIGLLK